MTSVGLPAAHTPYPLQVSLPRRGLSRVEAAVYVGVSLSLFDQMVRDRRMPHGLCKVGATLAAKNSATASQLMAMFGWLMSKMAEFYTKKAEQRRLAWGPMFLITLRRDASPMNVPLPRRDRRRLANRTEKLAISTS